MGVIGQSIVSTMMVKVINKCWDYLADQAGTVQKEDLIEKLKVSIPRIQAVVRDADSGHLRIEHGPLRDWWWLLKNALYAADDVLDDFNYLRLEDQALLNHNNTSSSSAHALYDAADVLDDFDCFHLEDLALLNDTSSAPPSKVRKVMDNSLSFSRKHATQIGMRAAKRDPLLRRLREVVRMFDDVCDGLDLFAKLVSQEQQRLQHHHDEFMARRETGSLFIKNSKDWFVGRDREREQIVELLLSNSTAAVSLVSIIGHGGMGKTALAQHVYDETKIYKHFDLMIWVCVSSNFDVKKLTRNMIESATRKTLVAVDSSLAALQGKLRESLAQSKRFLLVLDDAWNDKSSSDWEELLAPLKNGPAGSKILLTTRMCTVAEMVENGLAGEAPAKHVRTVLKGLAEREKLLLFDLHAFAGIENLDDCSSLRSIGKRIAEKLGGSPLAIKVVGDLLNSNMSEEYWQEVLDVDISDFEEGEEGIMSVLRLSYHHLPESLRPCFAYCSIFPPNYEFCKDDLIYMWMAMGFIQQSSQGPGETPEDIGDRYFGYLLKRSFFEFHRYKAATYVMHDLLHEMAQSISRDECLRFSGDILPQEFPSTVRQLSFINTSLQILGEVGRLEIWGNLRTLHLVYDEIGEEHVEVFKGVLEALKGVRVLTVSRTVMELLPDAIGLLTHLKYLRLFHPGDDWSSSVQLPNTLSKLYNLQVINFVEPRYYREFNLPPSMNDVICLRHLIPDHISGGIPGVGKLTSLMELVFTVKEKTGYKISELKRLNQLRNLKINGLENIKSQYEAREAELHFKEHLKELTLKWRWSGRDARDDSLVQLNEQVLDFLRPNSKTKELTIEGYMGAKSASWMGLQSLEKLEYMKLYDCPKLEQLPPLKKLSCLKYLYLVDIPAVRRLDFEGGFQKLEVLEIRKLEKLEEWYEPAVVDARSHWCPRLRMLKIIDCPKLKLLPDLPLSLEKAELSDVGLTALPKLRSTTSTISSSSSSFSLSSLVINNCPRLKPFAEGLLLQHRLGSLRYLWIRNCNQHMELSLENLCVQDLCLQGCPNLHLAVNTDTNSTDAYSLLASSLRKLSIFDCGDLDILLPTILHGAQSLYELYLGNCKNMVSLPPADVMRTLTSLKKLSIRKCEKLVSLEGLKALHHLRYLCIDDCSNLVKAASAESTNNKEKNKEEVEEEEFTLAVDEFDVQYDLLLLQVEPLRRLKFVKECIIRCECREMEMVEVVEPWLQQNRYVLEKLHLLNIATLQSLPASIKDLSTLKMLSLKNARQLQSLPLLPHSLERLIIDRCNQTLMERCKKGSGADWPNIKHIPKITLSRGPFFES